MVDDDEKLKAQCESLQAEPVYDPLAADFSKLEERISSMYVNAAQTTAAATKALEALKTALAGRSPTGRLLIIDSQPEKLGTAVSRLTAQVAPVAFAGYGKKTSPWGKKQRYKKGPR